MSCYESSEVNEVNEGYVREKTGVEAKQFIDLVSSYGSAVPRSGGVEIKSQESEVRS